jgi:hypothetical protein
MSGISSCADQLTLTSNNNRHESNVACGSCEQTPRLLIIYSNRELEGSGRVQSCCSVSRISSKRKYLGRVLVLATRQKFTTGKENIRKYTKPYLDVSNFGARPQTLRHQSRVLGIVTDVPCYVTNDGSRSIVILRYQLLKKLSRNSVKDID